MLMTTGNMPSATRCKGFQPSNSLELTRMYRQTTEVGAVCVCVCGGGARTISRSVEQIVAIFAC